MTGPGGGNPLQPEHFRRVDESPDEQFYVEPRFVQHIDDHAIAAITDFYRGQLPAGGAILDLMSSWVSHLPGDVNFGSVAGLGMNARELQANPQLTTTCVHDLNANPTLPYDPASFDAAVLTVSIQYLTSPVAVFTDLARVLRPGAPSIVTFSNRCFPTKAISAWQALDDAGHGELVGLYFRLAGGYEHPTAYRLRPPDAPGDPAFAVMATAAPASP